MSNVPSHVPSDLVYPYDFLADDRNRTDVWGFVKSATERPDIFYSPDLGGFWVVTKHELIREVFTSYELFSSRAAAIPYLGDVPDLIPPGIDPPEHRPYRRLLMQTMFAPSALKGIDADARKIARQLRDGFAASGACEFIADFAAQLPVMVFLNMMGMPADRRGEFMNWIHCFFQGGSMEVMSQARLDLHAYLEEWLDDLERKPTDGTGHSFRALLGREIDGRPLSRAEQTSIAQTLFFAGLDTVTSFMGHVMYFLACNPDHQAALRNDPAIMQKAMEEFFRRFGITNLGRKVTRDIVFHGVEFKAGDRVLVSTQISSLDPDQWDDAEAVDFARDTRDHLAFGAGPHVCIGNSIARIEMRAMLEELLPHMPNFRVKPGAIVRTFPGVVVGIEALPLVWDI